MIHFCLCLAWFNLIFAFVISNVHRADCVTDSYVKGLLPVEKTYHLCSYWHPFIRTGFCVDNYRRTMLLTCSLEEGEATPAQILWKTCIRYDTIFDCMRWVGNRKYKLLCLLWLCSASSYFSEGHCQLPKVGIMPSDSIKMRCGQAKFRNTKAAHSNSLTAHPPHFLHALTHNIPCFVSTRMVKEGTRF